MTPHDLPTPDDVLGILPTPQPDTRTTMVRVDYIEALERRAAQAEAALAEMKIQRDAACEVEDAERRRAAQAEAALRVYADPRNWGISRDDLNHRVVSWIGPGAEKGGMPDAPETARTALAAGDNQPKSTQLHNVESAGDNQ